MIYSVWLCLKLPSHKCVSEEIMHPSKTIAANRYGRHDKLWLTEHAPDPKYYRTPPLQQVRQDKQRHDLGSAFVFAV